MHTLTASSAEKYMHGGAWGRIFCAFIQQENFFGKALWEKASTIKRLTSSPNIAAGLASADKSECAPCIYERTHTRVHTERAESILRYSWQRYYHDPKGVTYINREVDSLRRTPRRRRRAEREISAKETYLKQSKIIALVKGMRMFGSCC
jgi:hypothetical protein